ncbi:antibiotic biosynthesis monooxygenase [Methylocystis sp. H4A]|uniref:antibiotic biosynthesis monooxygenase n=1 Tax=Methylocystis sp. H4A TaxID=2785788 RepID=UPI001FEE75C4|nr:antibiotic biosynthesis monooxygenase [Methylocystis sp. H4A]
MTLINVYEVEPEKQAEFVRLLSEATKTVIRRQPGFVSVSIHSGMDGKRVSVQFRTDLVVTPIFSENLLVNIVGSCEKSGWSKASLDHRQLGFWRLFCGFVQARLPPPIRSGLNR